MNGLKKPLEEIIREAGSDPWLAIGRALHEEYAVRDLLPLLLPINLGYDIIFELPPDALMNMPRLTWRQMAVLSVIAKSGISDVRAARAMVRWRTSEGIPPTEPSDQPLTSSTTLVSSKTGR